MALYNKKELLKKNGFQKLINKEPKENFIIELENLLSDYENSLNYINSDKSKDLFSKYSIKEDVDFLQERTSLESRYVKKCLSKVFLTVEDMGTITKLNNLLRLPASTVTAVIDDVAAPFYSARVNEYLRDGFITPEEKQALEQLRQQLQLSEATAKVLYCKAVKSQIDSYTKPVFDSEIFSPEDEKIMYEAASRLGIKLKFPADVQKKLSKYRQNWELMYGSLPVLQSDIMLQNNEVLHFRLPVDWLEERSVTRRVNYSGYTYSTKILGNLRWKAGSIRPNRITSQELTKLDSGILYLTNKRFIFNGKHGNKTLALNKILSFAPYADGMFIEKENGRSPFFACNCDMQQLAMLLDRLIACR